MFLARCGDRLRIMKQRPSTIRAMLQASVAALAVPLCVVIANQILSNGSNDPLRGVIRYDLGTVAAGEPVDRDVAIVNPRSQVARLREIASGCACVVHTASDGTIAPGSSANLHFTFTPPDRVGPFEHITVIKYEDAIPPTFLLISGTVARRIEVEPETIEMGDVIAGAQVTQSVSVRLLGDGHDVKLDWQHATIATAATSVDGKTCEYAIEFSPPRGVPLGPCEGRLLITAQGREKSVPCFARVIPRWTATPPQAFFGVVSRGSRPSIVVQLRCQDPSEFEAFRLVHDLPPAFIVSPSKAERSLVVHITIGADREGLHSGTISFLREDEEVAAVVPVSAFVR